MSTQRGYVELCTFLPTAILLQALSSAALGTTLTVSNDGSGDHNTIVAAMAAADTGDTVRVEPGTYRESVALKSGVVLQGSGREDTRIEMDAAAAPVWAIGVSDAEVSGFTVAYPGTEAFDVIIDSSQVRIVDCHVSNSSALAVYVTGGSVLQMEDCVVDPSRGGIYLTGASEGLIRAVRVENSTLSGVCFLEGAFGEVAQSQLRHHGNSGMEVPDATPRAFWRLLACTCMRCG